jgi:hypothetical protein
MPKLPKRINPYLPDMADSTYLIKDQFLVIMLRSTNTFITLANILDAAHQRGSSHTTHGN